MKYLQLAETLSSFREKLLARAKTLDVRERQQILRLLVKEILVDTQSITIRHSIPISHTEKNPIPNGTPASQPIPPGTPQPSYLLRPRSVDSKALQLARNGQECCEDSGLFALKTQVLIL